jgi:uncharacterized protein YbbC (DUF1343 family)
MPVKGHAILGLVGIWGLSLICPGRPDLPATTATIRPGIEVLLSDSMQLVRGRRVGLVTNQAGVDSRGVSDVDRLRAADVTLVALFSPEHGFRGTAAPGAEVASGTDSATGLPIYSLYGANTAPTDSMLSGVDVLLVDLQDAGARYYTYLFTVVEVMRSAARHGTTVIVLDRPNPIGGAVQGNVLDTAFRSPVGMLAIPMRHGMTLGELALLAKHDLGLGTDLRVVPMRGWKRSMYFDETGLPFIPPSPNLKTVEALIHYPGTCLFEGTTLSVGRGTDHPFEQVGAPWVDTVQVLTRMRAESLPGVAFQAVSFTPHQPGDGKYADTALVGIRLKVTDRNSYNPIVTAIALMATLDQRQKSPGSEGAVFPQNARQLTRLLGQDLGVLALQITAFQEGSRASILERLAGWPAARSVWVARSRPFLLYRE